MANVEREPDEVRILRHPPVWVDLAVVALILLIEVVVIVSAAQELTDRPKHDEQIVLTVVIVGTLFVGATLQFAVLAVPPLIEVTDRHIVLRRRLGWDEPEITRLDAIEAIQQQGWRLTVSGDGTHLSFFCPPPFAPRLRRAIERVDMEIEG